MSGRDAWAVGLPNDQTLILGCNANGMPPGTQPRPSRRRRFLIGLAAGSARDQSAAGRTLNPISGNAAIIAEHWTGRTGH